MAVGGVLGATTGGVLGALDLIAPWAFWGVLILGIYLVTFSWLDASNTRELAGALFKALAGVVGGALGLALVFGSVIGIFFAVDAAFSLPPWGAHWDRYPITAQYLVEAVGAAIWIALMGWAFKEWDVPWLDNALVWLLLAAVGGMAGMAINTPAMVPFLPVILPLGLLDAWPGGPLGALVGGLLGGAYGALLGGLAKFAVDVIDSW